MTFNLIFPAYFIWHYGAAFTGLLALYKTALWFTWRFFSVGTLIRTLFSPWRRLGEEYKKGFDPEAFFGTLLVNTLMRIIGAIFRLVLVVIGMATLLIVALGGLATFVVWTLMPALVVLGVSTGLALLAI